MNKFVRFDPDANKPHKVSMVVCLRCLKRWVAVRPVGTRLVQLQLQCPGCRMDGGAIETGEDISGDGAGQ